MPNFAANLMFLFTEIPLYDRFGAAKDAGFDLIEYQFPYDVDPEVLSDALTVNAQRMVLINAPCGDRQAGERGIAALPDREEEFREGIETALVYAKHLSVPVVHIMSGVVEPGEEDYAVSVYANNLRDAAPLAAAQGVTLTVEPINGHDVPGYLVQHTQQARAITAMVGAPNVMLQYDAYHALMNGEDPIDGVRANLDTIAHIQVAGCPGRHEPDTGDFDYFAFFEFLDTVGYTGAIGCEYVPRTDTRAGLKWATRYGIGRDD